mgnify:CR=1 FL=1
MGLLDDYTNGVGFPRPKWGHPKVLGRELIVRFPDAEYFVYDYEKGILFGYDVNADEWISSEGCEINSRYLCRPLTDYLS